MVRNLRPCLAVAAVCWLFVAAGAALGVPKAVQPPRNVLETPVERLADGLRKQGLLAVAQWPQVRGLERRLGRPVVGSDRLLLELHAESRADTSQWLQWAAATRVRSEAEGTDSWLAWVPLSSLKVLNQWPGLSTVRLPWPVRSLQGQVLSKGATQTGTTARHCHGARGKGVQVAVVDEEWYGFGAALAQEEVLDVQGKAPFQGSEKAAWHGTGCAEIVADMAPDAQIWPIQAATLPELQVQVGKLAANGVQIISQSSGWTTGYSFGDGAGKACALATTAKKGGIAWVAAAGNEGGGHQWRGTWDDHDGDGWLDFAKGDEGNGFYAPGGYQVDIEFDWNAYPATAIDLDLFLCANQNGACQELASSKSLQSGSQTPAEVIWFQVPKSGTYFLRIHAKTAVPTGLALRMVAQGSGPLQHHSKTGTIVDPAACADVVAVGAAEAQSWSGNSIANYSAQGPTFDGRTKPDILGPTEVDIAVSAETFDGTSAACPHVAGALAVLIGNTAMSPDQAIAELLDQADTHGLALPDSVRGRGWLALAGPQVGCLPETTDTAACTTTCGTSGATACEAPCEAVTCTALDQPCAVPSQADAVDDTDGVSGQDGLAVDGGADLAALPTPAPEGGAASGDGCTAAQRSPWAAILGLLGAAGAWVGTRRRSGKMERP